MRIVCTSHTHSRHDRIEIPPGDILTSASAVRTRTATRSTRTAIVRREGQTVGGAAAALQRLSVAEKNDLLSRRGTNFNDLPLWQRRVVGVRRRSKVE